MINRTKEGFACTIGLKTGRIQDSPVHFLIFYSKGNPKKPGMKVKNAVYILNGYSVLCIPAAVAAQRA